MQSAEVGIYFDNFTKLVPTLEDNDSLNRLGCIHSINTSFQQHNETGSVIATMHSENISVQTVTCSICCNAEGIFSPATIFKGEYEKQKFGDYTPDDYIVYISEKAAYFFLLD
ncbi:hypothetical protein JTB14_018295 [Gonioctena quinquepunctata]|nr:hypothetical protein JTB14_018295 [Gonioctena quinquepunctata]